MPTRRYFSNFAPRQTLANSIGSSDTTCQIAGSFAGWPTQFPFYATLGYGLSSAEIVSVTNIVGTTATITRAQNGSVAVAHPAGETMDQTAIAQDFDEANAHTSASTGVHGISGHVVGDTDAQTLTNKTLTAPVINGANITGATNVSTGNLSATGPASVGSLAVNGAITLADGLPEMSTTDWNTATLPGLYTASTAANAPAGGNLTALVANVGGATQQIIWDGAGNEWRRVNTGTWSAWTPSAFSKGNPLFVGYQNAVQSIPNATWTPVTLQGSQVDTHSGWSATTNPTRYTAQVAGWYRVNGVVGFGNNTTGSRDASPFVNGSQANTIIWQTTQVAPSVDYVLTEGVVRLLVGDYVEIQGYQSSGAALSTVAFQSSMAVEWLRN